MTRINTTQQSVDKEKYSEGWDMAFGTKPEKGQKIDIDAIVRNAADVEFKPRPMHKRRELWDTVMLGVFSGLVVGTFVAGLIYLGLMK